MTKRVDRRQFARNVVGTAAVTAGLDRCAAADQERVESADLLLAALKDRFPDRLNDEQWGEVRSKLDGQLQASQTLSQFRLKNSDEPVTVFTPALGVR